MTENLWLIVETQNRCGRLTRGRSDLLRDTSKGGKRWHIYDIEHEVVF